MLALTGMILFAFIFVAWRFNRFNVAFWFWAVLGMLTWLITYGLFKTVASLF